LIGAAERAMEASGFSVATLWVLPDNEPAVRCYARCGSRPDGAERFGDFGGEEFHSVSLLEAARPIGRMA
jgi:RimJ/RimL family protein N-acetyltransferase